MSNSLQLPSNLDNNRKTVVLEPRITTGAVQNQPHQPPPIQPPLVQVQVQMAPQQLQQVQSHFQLQPHQVQPQIQVQPQVLNQVQPIMQVQTQVQPQVQSQVQTPPQPEKPEEPQKKLSPAEIQRMKINAASEYFRKLRENAGASNDTPAHSDKTDTKSGPSKQITVPITVTPMVQVQVSSAATPLGPPPPLIPTTSAAQKSMPELVVTTNSAILSSTSR